MGAYYDRDGRPISLAAWLALLGSPGAKRVALTQVGPYMVSTVWLGLDHSFGAGDPLIFETMVFPAEGWADPTERNPAFEFQDRYASEQRAREGHAETVLLICATLSEQWPDLEPVEMAEEEGW